MPTTSRPRDKGIRTTRSRAKKAKGLTCRNCRTRKIRCDGSLPNCGICRAYGEDCLYDKAPPMSQILAMTERIAQLEKASQNDTRLITSPDSRDLATTQVGVLSGAVRSPSIADSVPRSGGDSSNLPSGAANTLENGPLTNDNAYYETTSSVHAPETLLQQEQSPNTATPYTRSHGASVQPLKTLSPGSRNQLSFWEDKVIEAGSVELHLPESTVRHLLHTHWTWVHPAFMFVHKETFLRDAATGGEFYSPLLLSVICLHSTRFTDHHLDEELLARTKLYLGHAMHQEPSIPMTQALLQHSAREIGRGNLSQAWLYSGMAFRLAADLGLFTRTWTDYEDTDTVQARRNQISCQLAWSCFLWDKIISLYFGRHPTLQEPPAAACSFEGLSDGDDLWQPYDAEGIRNYPPLQSQKIACFTNFCKLGIIINDVLLNIYGKQRTQDVVEFIRSANQRLQIWRNNSPSGLRIDVSGSPDERFHCPPQHILTQKLVVFASPHHGYW